jgi:hypothetical protein
MIGGLMLLGAAAVAVKLVTTDWRTPRRRKADAAKAQAAIAERDREHVAKAQATAATLVRLDSAFGPGSSLGR